MLLALCILALLVGTHAGRPDGDSGFFLKAPKSVPRAGRSAPGQYDGFFLKASKSVPRVGRRDGNKLSSDVYEKPYDNPKLIDITSSPFMGEATEDIYVFRNYPEYDLSEIEKDLPHRTRRYNMAPFLNTKANGREYILPYTNEMLNDHNSD